MARHYRTDDVLDYSGEPTHRLRPPSRLAPRAKAIFIHLVNNTATGHFKASDQGLLERLCETQMIAEIAAEKLASEGAVDADGKVSGWFQVHTVASRTASSLATPRKACSAATKAAVAFGNCSQTSSSVLLSSCKRCVLCSNSSR